MPQSKSSKPSKKPTAKGKAAAPGKSKSASGKKSVGTNPVKAAPKAKAPKKPSKAVAKKPVKAAKAAPKPKAVKTTGKKPPISTKPSKPQQKQIAAPKSGTFLVKQKHRLLTLKDMLLDSMSGVAKDTLRSRAEGSEGNAFGMHQADAGSDAYDRDFALSLLSQEQNSLYEIDEALKRLEEGGYGVCEISGKSIPHARLEALPFTRYTVECQAELEKQNRFRAKVPVTSLFGLGDDSDDDDDSGSADNKE